MARKPEGNHEAYKKSGFLRTTKKSQSFMTIWNSKSSISFYTKIKVTKAESNIKLFPIEKKFSKLFFKRCIGGNISSMRCSFSSPDETLRRELKIRWDFRRF